MAAQNEKQRLAQKQQESEKGIGRGNHPNTRAALSRYAFQPGQSGNPGGLPKGTEKISAVYRRLLGMSIDQLMAFQPTTGAEVTAWRMFEEAVAGDFDAAFRAIREVTDRTEGRSKQTVEAVHASERERLILRVQERYFARHRVQITRGEAIEAIVAYRPELADAFEQ